MLKESVMAYNELENMMFRRSLAVDRGGRKLSIWFVVGLLVGFLVALLAINAKGG